MIAKIRLEPFTENDIERLIHWIPSSDFLLQWAGPTLNFPLDKDQLEKHLEFSKTSSSIKIYKVIELINGEVIGHGELGQIDLKNLSAKLMRVLVGPKELRGKGIGELIIKELLGIGFEELFLHRIDLHAFDFNTAAIRCYEKVGFRIEGVMREARKHGNEYWNVCIMSLLRDEWTHNK